VVERQAPLTNKFLILVEAKSKYIRQMRNMKIQKWLMINEQIYE
jgi:hypothetical protein